MAPGWFFRDCPTLANYLVLDFRAPPEGRERPRGGLRFVYGISQTDLEVCQQPEAHESPLPTSDFCEINLLPVRVQDRI
jgi:hypothetical protein